VFPRITVPVTHNGTLVRYVDDATIIAEDPNDLELLVNKVKHASAEVGLELNLAKTKELTTGKS
jgi:Reverse transcriptase (RNA-dependent DNA polymerase).